MANLFKSVLSAAAAILQSKTRTATTTQQVVTADAGYDGLSSVTIDPQQHTETYTPAANTASNDMGAVHNKRYVNTSGMIVPTGNKSITANGTGIDVSNYATADVAVSIPTISSVTPDNTYPATLTKDSNYTPSKNGYAIASYSSIVPSNASPVSIGNDDVATIYRLSKGSSGYAIASYSNITPSDSSPAAMTSGSIYKMGDTGYAIGSIPANLTPSNTSPPWIVSGTIYKGGGTGYAISSYSSASKTPSPSGTSFSLGWNYMTAAGYAYSSQPSMTETTLWTNSSPASSFAEQDITLSQGISNFKYIKITSRAADNDSTSMSAIFTKEDLQASTSSSKVCALISGTKVTSMLCRKVFYKSNTSLTISKAFVVTTSGSGSYNTCAIPTGVYGLK